MPYGIWKNMEKTAASQYSLTMFFRKMAPFFPIKTGHGPFSLQTESQQRSLHLG
jgi:hypothetical protein